MANAEQSRQLSSCTSMWIVRGQRLKLQLKRFDLNIPSCAATAKTSDKEHHLMFLNKFYKLFFIYSYWFLLIFCNIHGSGL